MKSNYNLPFFQKLVLILIILPMLSFTVFAQSTRYVNVNVIGGSNNGTTWGNAYNNLHTALVAAQSGDEIWVAKGTYLPTADASGATSPINNRTKTFVMKNGVAIYGGFSGNGTETRLSDRDFKNNVTKLSGDIGTVNVSSDNCYHVILNNFSQVTPLTNTAILDGFTIADGNANGTYPDFDGAGMYNQYASPTLNNLIFTNNNASKNGGGIVNFNSSAPSINNVIFSGNTANTGGAMNNQTSSNAILTNVSFVGNSATTNGGAMYNYNIVSPNLKNVIFSGNYADLGGGMYNEQRASPILINCTFSGNFARTDGGGLYNFNNSNPQIKNSIIWGNGNEITNISNSVPTYIKSVIKTKNLGSGVFAGSTDPLFVSQPSFFDAPTTAGDLRLQLCSPAINIGDNTGVTNKDLDGNNRIFENTVDLGAYEFQQNRNPINVSVSSTLICDKSNVDLLATCDNGNVTWYNAAINGIVLGTGSSFRYTPQVGVNQTFYASCVIIGKCERDRIATSNTLTVNALPIPTANAISPICAGTTLNLSSGNTGVSTSNSFSWTGVNSFTSTAQNPSILNASTSATGTYQVIITNDKGCTAMATTSATVNALPIPTANAISPICAGTTLNLSSGNNGISTTNAYVWTGVNSFTSTAQNPSILNASTSATGTYQVIITNDKGCTAIATTSAIVNALPTATVSSNSPICAGTSLNLVSSGGISYIWTGVNSFSSTEQNPTILSATTLASGTYRVTVTNANGCTAVATTSVIVNALPTSMVTSNSPVCVGSALNLSANGGLSYAWTGVNSFTSTQQNPTITSVTNSTNGTYQVVVTNAAGCTAIATTSVIVNALPTATATSNSPICSGANLNLIGEGISNPNFAPSGSYAWSGPNSFSSTLQNPSIASATTLATGTYQLIITNENGCTAMATTSVIVNALPTATVSSNAPICSGTSLNLSAGGGSSYLWTGTNSFSSTEQNPSIVSATTLASGTYQVTVTNTNGCTAIATAFVLVNPIPVTPTTQANTQIILGGNVTLTATGCSNSNDVLKWYQSADNTLVTMPVSPTLTSNYYAKCETTLNGITCISAQSTDVTVTVLSPTPPIATGGTTCISTPVNLMATGCTGSTGTFVLKWYQNTDNALVSMPVSPNVNTDYYAKCEQTFNGVTAISEKSNVVTVTVLHPAIPVATEATIYNGNSTTLTATGCTGDGFVVRWYQTSDNASVTKPVSPSLTTQYYAKCEQTANGVTCTSSKSNDVTVKVINRIFVDISKASAPIQNGNSWATAYGNLQTGLAAATAGVEIWVAKGTYKTTSTLDRTISFNIPNNVIVYGGFAGTENALSERNFRTNACILSGEIGNQEIKTDNSYHVVVINGNGSSTRLDGFSIVGGNANFNKKLNSSSISSNINAIETIEMGGGVIVQNGASPKISNCIFLNNSGILGAALFVGGNSKIELNSCKFLSNEATFGSAIYLQNSQMSLVNGLISGNYGLGSIYNNQSILEINHCTISGNGGDTGLLYNANANATVKNSIIWGNSDQVKDNKSTISYSIVQGGYPGIGNFSFNPQFVDGQPAGNSPTLNGDYHLKANSIAINRGINENTIESDLDLDGNPRMYNGGKVDMGAYEFQGNPTGSLVISLSNGNWESNSTWDIGRIPSIGDTVIIDNNHIVNLNGVGNAQTLDCRGTGKLKFITTDSKLNLGY